MTDDSMLKRPYKIVEYNPAWIEKYEKIKDLLLKVFGQKILQIEHVGSTSMPGMTSKGVIDVCIIVDHMETFEEQIQKMVELGYKYRINYINPDTIMIYKEKPDTKKEINIHIISKDNKLDIDKFIVERDYFRIHPERMKIYNELKKKLNEQFPDDYVAYRAGKKDFLMETLELARKWKSEQNQ